MKADKHNTVVIIDKPDCIQRAENMTKDGSYKIFRINNPLNNFQTFVANSLKKCKHIANRDLIRRLTVPKIKAMGNPISCFRVSNF